MSATIPERRHCARHASLHLMRMPEVKSMCAVAQQHLSTDPRWPVSATDRHRLSCARLVAARGEKLGGAAHSRQPAGSHRPSRDTVRTNVKGKCRIPTTCRTALDSENADFAVEWAKVGVRNRAKEKGSSEDEPKSLIPLVGARGFEPPTPCTPCTYATRLRYAPTRPRL